MNVLLNLLPIATPLSVVKRPFVDFASREFKVKIAVTQAFLPSANQDVSVGILQLPLAVLLAVGPVTNVDVSVGKAVGAEPVPSVVLVLAHVSVAGVRAACPPKDASSLLDAIDVLSFVPVAAFTEQIQPFAGSFAVHPVARVDVTVGKRHLAFALLLTVNKVPHVPSRDGMGCWFGPLHFPVSVPLVVLVSASKFVAISERGDAQSAAYAVEPLARVLEQRFVIPLVRSTYESSIAVRNWPQQPSSNREPNLAVVQSPRTDSMRKL